MFLLYPNQLAWLCNGPQKTTEGELDDERGHDKMH